MRSLIMPGKAWAVRGRTLGIIVAALSGVIVGCGGGTGVASQRVHAVTGKVELPDGKPLAGGTVYFVPKDGVVVSEGRLDSDGKFTLVTGGSGDGAPAGEYRIRVEPADKSLLSAGQSNGAKKRLPFNRKYLDEDTSNLTAVVKEGANDVGAIRLR